MRTVVNLYNSLISLFEKTRNNFDHFETEAKKISNITKYEKDSKRNRKIKALSDESRSSEEVKMDGRENLRINAFLVIIDNLVDQLQMRREAYKQFHDKFAFLTDTVSISSSSFADSKKSAEELIASYPEDIEADFIQEFIHFREHVEVNEEKDLTTPIQLLKWLRQEGMQSIYPNVDIALRICVCTPATNCTGERSFSCLQRVENFYRSKMTQDKLNDVAILNIESDITIPLTYEDVIDDFANMKVRRVPIKY